MTHRAVIIGAGSIGAIKDIKKDNIDTREILTIAHAFYSNPKICLDGIVDTDIVKADFSKHKWDIQESAMTMEDLPQLLRETTEIVAVAVNTENHFPVLEKLPSVFPAVKAVLIEKPFCENPRDAEWIKKQYDALGITIVVDYLRRFEKGITILKDALLRDVEEIYSVVFYYNRGLQRDGCHAIDLIRNFFGEVTHCEEIKKASSIIDLNEQDPTIGVRFITEKCDKIFMLPVDGRKLGVFEMVVMTSKGKLVLKDFSTNFIWYQVKTGNEFGEYPVLADEPLKFKTDLLTALGEVANNLVDIIENNADPICSAQDAIRVQEIISTIKNGGNNE